jgi:hypothetical protein
MLGAGLTPHDTKRERRWSLTALKRRWGGRKKMRRAASGKANRTAAEAHALPAIVVKAQEDARCRQALARLGYAKVRSHYARAKRRGKPTFAGLHHVGLAPTLPFVKDWLTEERKRIFARARGPFLMTMLATIVAGIVFVAVTRVLD